MSISIQQNTGRAQNTMIFRSMCICHAGPRCARVVMWQQLFILRLLFTHNLIFATLFWFYLKYWGADEMRGYACALKNWRRPVTVRLIFLLSWRKEASPPSSCSLSLHHLHLPLQLQCTQVVTKRKSSNVTADIHIEAAVYNYTAFNICNIGLVLSEILGCR